MYSATKTDAINGAPKNLTITAAEWSILYWSKNDFVATTVLKA